jgi:hypothetical protein
MQERLSAAPASSAASKIAIAGLSAFDRTQAAIFSSESTSVTLSERDKEV